MEKIQSFTIDHDNHDKGFYLSYINNDIYTYDLRFKTPNGGDYLNYSSIHTIEHLFATVIRNSNIKDNVVYFGPMGCRTGFYLLLRNIDKNSAFSIVKSVIEDCLELESIPGASRIECGNYMEHDLNAAKADLRSFLGTL